MALVAGLVGGFLLLAAGGGVAAWFALRTPEQPEETAAATAPGKSVQQPAPDEKAPGNKAEVVKPTNAEPAKSAGDTPNSSGPKVLTGEQINHRLLKSTAFIVSLEGSNIGCGSGALIHGPRKLVITNYHVVGENNRVLVFFAQYDSKKDLITSPAYYGKNVKSISTRAEVIARNSKLDLAVLELEKAPASVIGLPLAAKPAGTGSNVYSLGGSGVDLDAFLGQRRDAGALWRLTSGTVRGRHRDTAVYRSGQRVDAMFLETQSPVNPGDSGGPTVNERGELVGVVAAFNGKDRLVSTSIDLLEVRDYLASVAKDGEWTWIDTEAAPQVPADPSNADVSPVILLARAKSGPTLQRVEAIDQLGQLGDKARFTVPDLIVLLDDSEESVRRVTADALDRIGSPAPADAACIPRALAGTGRQSRLYALKHYSKIEAASAELLPLIAKALSDTDLPTRDQALTALERVGPKCKPAAFAALLGRILDSDAALAARVAKTLTVFAPYEGAERKLLIENLTHQAWQMRRIAVVLLAPSAADESLASVWFEPRLKDVSAEVRAAALPALAKWPGAMQRIQPVLIGLVRDDHAAVRTAAIRALGTFGTGAEAKSALLGLAGSGVAAETRELALQALLGMNFTDAKADLPILSGLLKLDDPGVKAGALAKAAGLKAEAKVLLPKVEECIRHDDPAVQVAAMKLAASIGPEAAALVPRISALILPNKNEKPAESVQLQAVAALAQLGPTAKASLVEALAAPLPANVIKSVCDSLGGKGAEVPAKSIPHLFALAERTEALRPALGDLLARIGGDDIARLCADRTFWSFKILGNGQKIKECKYELAVQVWAIETMGKLDPKALTEKGRSILIERMKSLPKTNPDVECKRAAEAAGLKLIAAGLADKP